QQRGHVAGPPGQQPGVLAELVRRDGHYLTGESRNQGLPHLGVLLPRNLLLVRSTQCELTAAGVIAGDEPGVRLSSTRPPRLPTVTILRPPSEGPQRDHPFRRT